MKLRLALAAAAVLVLWPATAVAQDPKIEVDPDDMPLKISGVIGDAAGFEGPMRLTATGKVGTFRWLFSDLRLEDDPDQRIARSDLSLVGASAMEDGDTIDVEVNVAGVEEPGNYKGQVELIPAGQKRSAATKVPIELAATALPVLTMVAGRDKVSGTVTKCGTLGCDITGFLVPGDAGNKKKSIEFTLGKGQKATVSAIDVFADGEENEHQASAAELGVPDKVDESTRVLRVPTEIDSNLHPDHYTGAIHLAVDGVAAPTVVPVDFSVRAEPLFALIVLLVGVIVGWITKLFRGRGTELYGLYLRADALERKLNASSITDKTAIQAMIDSARASIGANDVDGAKNTLDDAETALKDAGVTFAPPTAPDGPGATPKAPFYRRKGFLRFLSYLAGFAVLVVIVFTGFQTQYVDKGTTFGAGDLWDYIALAAWGFAAGLAGKAVASAGPPTGTG